MKAIAIDIGGTNIRIAYVSKDKISNYYSESLDTKNVLTQIYRLIDEYANDVITGIGISIPAIIDMKKGIIIEAFNIPVLKGVNLISRLKKRYDVTVRMNNDANCFALGESIYGASRKSSNSIGIIIGTGFGAGIIINNKIYNGNLCAAGEFGRSPYLDKTIEDYCSGKFFRKQKIEAQAVNIMAKKGNKDAKLVFSHFGKNLGCALATVCNALSPEIIVIGGGVSQALPFFRKEMIKSFKQYTYKEVYSSVKILKYGKKHSALLGAAALLM